MQAAQYREQAAAAAAAQTALTNSVALLTTKLLDQEKVIADFTSEKESEKEEEKEVPYVPHRDKENSHPERPKFQKNNEPQLYDPANIDAVWQLLCTAERATAAGWCSRPRARARRPGGESRAWMCWTAYQQQPTTTARTPRCCCRPRWRVTSGFSP